MKLAKFAAVTAAVAALGFGTASEGLAQVCMGTPIVSGQRALSLGVGFPENGNSYQARLDVNTRSPLAFNVGYSRDELSGVSGTTHAIGGGVAYQLPTTMVAENTALTACPVGQVAYAFTSGADDWNQVNVPLGLSVGARVGLTQNVALVPYVTPQIIFSRTSVQGVSNTDTGYGATFGSALDFGPFYAGLDMTTTRMSDVPGTNSQVGVRVGVKF